MTIRILTGDCRDVMATMEPESVDACVTDPPYHLTAGKKGGCGDASVNLNTPYGRSRITVGFMNQTWDGGDIAFRPETWAAVFRVLKPGAHLLAFSGTRTQHRMVCAIEDAGFEIRDQFYWHYGSGFPKSLDVSKAIDKAVGAEREKVPPRSIIGHQRNIGNRRPYMDNPDHMTVGDTPATPEATAWQGWGTAVKPATEPICFARKPLEKGLTVAQNVLKWGTGALNIDGCRVETTEDTARVVQDIRGGNYAGGNGGGRLDRIGGGSDLGRWPANLIHDGSDEVLACFPAEAGGGFGVRGGNRQSGYAFGAGDVVGFGDTGSASRFFYCAKASRSERGEGNDHPTVKPVELMRWLVRLVTPPGGHVLDPFAGSGTTGIAADIEQMNATLIEQDPKYTAMAARRIREEGGLFAEVAAE